MRIASRRVVLPHEGNTVEIAPAMLTWTGSTIDSVDIIEGDYSEFIAKASAEAPLEDFDKRLISPAFIDAHTHLGLTFLRGTDLADTASRNMVEEVYYKAESKLEAEDVRAFTRLAAYECLLNGTAMVFDHYYYGQSVANGLLDAGLCGVVSPTLQDISGPGIGRWEQELQTTIEMNNNEALKKGGIQAAFGPHASDTVSDALWTQIAQLSRQHRLPIHAHLAQSQEEFERSIEQHGISPVQRLHRQGVIAKDIEAQWVHMHYSGQDDLALVANAAQRLVVCPHSALIFGFPARTQFWHRAKLMWSVGTDCAPTNDSLSVQKELRFLAGQGTMATAYRPAYESYFQQPTPDQARTLWGDREAARTEATLSSASLLRRVWDIPGSLTPHIKAGVLARGAYANILVWDHHHPVFWPDQDPLRVLAYGAPSGAIWGMWSAGKEIGKRGHFHASILNSDQYHDAYTEAQRRWLSLGRSA